MPIKKFVGLHVLGMTLTTRPYVRHLFGKLQTYPPLIICLKII